MNLWDPEFNMFCEYYDNIEYFLNKIGKNIVYLEIKDNYNIKCEPSNIVEDSISKNLIYTDSKHKALIASFIDNMYFINSNEYKKNKNYIINKKIHY